MDSSACGARRRSDPNHPPTCSGSARATADTPVNAIALANAATALRVTDGTPVPPFRAQQPDEEHQHDGHMPQVVLFNRGDAAAGVAKIVGKACRIVGLVEM